MYGSIGKLGINAIPLTTNQAIAYTNSKPISSKYLFYYLMSARAGLISRGKGGTQSNISQTVIKGFPFLVAPLPEQHRIVEAIESFLTRLDDAMATLERLQRNLKRYRASVLKAAVQGRLVPSKAGWCRPRPNWLARRAGSMRPPQCSSSASSPNAVAAGRKPSWRR
jgi:type I restriction enzyme S subunit